MAEARGGAPRVPRQGYDALSAALGEHLPDWTWDAPRGGCTLWVRMPGGDARAFGQVAQRCGVNVVPGQVLSAEGRHGDRLRIPFVHAPEVIAEAVRRLAWPGSSTRARRPDGADESPSCDGSGAQPVSRPSINRDRPAREAPRARPTPRRGRSRRAGGLIADQRAPSRAAQNGPRAQWAEPVTGSSGMPVRRGEVARGHVGAVAPGGGDDDAPALDRREARPCRGRAPATSAGVAASTSQSKRCGRSSAARAPSASTSPAGASAGSGGGGGEVHGDQGRAARRSASR